MEFIDIFKRQRDAYFGTMTSMWRDRLRKRKMLRRTYSRPLLSRNILKIVKLAFLGVVGIFIATFIFLPFFAFNLPSPDKIVRREGYSTKILDRNGEILYDIYLDQRRTAISFDEMPVYLRQATIAIEDKNFYKHQGFDPAGMIRGLSRIFTRGYAQGGSTLTQQLVKNVLLSPERSIFRKVKEFLLAIQIERKYSKDEILQMYLNEAPYGGTAWGVETAAEIYFGKNVKDLTLVESAILAGLPQRPSVYSPYSSTPKAYVGRAQEVLRRMKEDGYITKEQEKAARDELDNVTFQEKGASFKAPHFVQYVEKVLSERYGEAVVEQGGLKVTTTLDLKLQEKAQAIVKEEIAKVEKQHITNGALIAINPETGEVLAMVGSKDFNAPDYDGQFNTAVSALRQPGSAFKPFTYVTALKKGYTASTLIMDVPTTFPGGIGQPDYIPVNYDGKFKGPIQLRFALGNSINIAAVKMLARVGIKDTLETAYALGIKTLEPNNETLNRVGLSLTLGGGEVRLIEITGAYAAFLNGGYRVEPVSILKVEDSDGKVLEENKPKKGKRVLSEQEAFMIADILADNNARKDIFGLNSLLNIPGRTVAVKTGTTNDKRDNWTVGGNSVGLVGVWVGNNDFTPMLQVASGVSGASPIWRRAILEILKDKPDVKFSAPSGILTASVDSVSGFRAHDGYPARSEYFIKGTEPGDDPVHTKLKVCISDGKLATPSDISNGSYDEKEYFVFKEEDPTAKAGEQNRWQKGILEWLNTQTDPRYHPPSDYCGSGSPVSLNFSTPQDHDSNLTNTLNIKINADSTSNIVQVELFVDESKIRTFTDAPYEQSINLTDGVHTIRVKAKDENSKEAERTITVGINVAWDYSPTLSPSPTP